MRHRYRRRLAAMFGTLALCAGLIGVSTTPASAESVPYTCGGADQATQDLLDLLATLFAEPGEEPELPATLDIDVDIVVSAPGTVDVGESFDADFDISVILPADLLDTIAGLGIDSVDVIDQVATIEITNATPSQVVSPPHSETLDISVGAATVPTFSGSLTATGPDQSLIEYFGGDIVFDVQTPPIAGLFPAGLFLALACLPAPDAPAAAATAIVEPGPPVAGDVEFSIPLGGSRTVTLPILANPEVDDVQITVQGVRGTASDPELIGGEWRTTYTHDPLEGPGTDVLEYTATNALGSDTGVITVSILGNQCEASPSCSLDQVIEFEILGDVLSMEQEGAEIELDPITLNGSPQATSGFMNTVFVVDARGMGAPWDLVGQVTDFKTDGAPNDCPANDPETWDFRCIPGDNLGWTPGASVAHQQIPGDVATVAPGADILVADIADGELAGVGLGSTAQLLCGAPATQAGGTFACGAGLTLLVPASAAAGNYLATLTITLS